jgi:glucokinase
MFLGVEIGGTKLQLGVGHGDGRPLVALDRLRVQPEHGAEGIRRQIAETARPLIERYAVKAVGFGFGGPVDTARGVTITSHQIDGWKNFPLADWGRETFGLPALVTNDSDSAGLAEARFGGGHGHRVVFYSNVGSGIGGALVIDGQLYPGGRGVASELGHLRPGLECQRADQTVESLASGWGITAAVRQRLTDRLPTDQPGADDLLERCGGQISQVTTQLVAQAATAGNRLALDALDRACRVYGWGLAQMLTLVAPNVVVLGGGVSLIGEELWLRPLRAYVRQYAFPPLVDTIELVPAKLGEEVVVYGVLALAAEAEESPPRTEESGQPSAISVTTQS